MKIYSWILTIVLSAVISGCGSSNDDDLFPQGSNDPALIQDRVWALFAVQDDSGNQIQVFQEPGFEFSMAFFSDFITIDAQEQEVRPVGGINVCNVYNASYTLMDGLLTLTNGGQDDRDCERGGEIIPLIFWNVLFGSGGISMLSINTETYVLTITSGNNEVLFFRFSNEPLFPGVVSGAL